MTTDIIKKHNKNQMSLIFDGLIPEEAHEILDAVFDDEVNELLQWTEGVTLGYNVDRYKIDKDELCWSHSLTIFIDSIKAKEEEILASQIDEQMKDDYAYLEKIQKFILERTGLKPEEEP